MVSATSGIAGMVSATSGEENFQLNCRDAEIE